MGLVATLVAGPAGLPLDPAVIGLARDVLRGGLVEPLAADASAIDVHFAEPVAGEAGQGEPESCRHLADRLRAELAVPVDIIVQPAEDRRKRLLVADMDSTMIEQECIDELAGALGLKETVAAITERAMRGEIDFEGALIERVALLEGVPASAIDRLLAEVITLTPGARTLIATMRRHGAYTALVSGGFTAFAGPVAQRLGMDEFQANTLILDGDRIAGRLATPILGAEAKRERLARLTAERGLPRAATLAVGDGANDLAMFAAAGLGVAYRAKPKVAATAAARIEHGDLTTLLYYQGYNRSEFIGDQAR